MSNQIVATHLRSFEGIEEPMVRFIVAGGSFEPDDFQNILEVGEGIFRMTLRHFHEEWGDGDRSIDDKTRQRAEVKGLGRRQEIEESFEYGTTWRSSPSLRGTAQFCHIFQLKATNDDGPPLVTLSIKAGSGHAAVQYTAADAARTVFEVRTFAWVPETWQSVRIRIKPTALAAGDVLVSVDGDEFQGASGVVLNVPHKIEYRPKWGFYRRITDDLRNGEDFVEHKDVIASAL